ncbi:MAG: insulinase family protein [Ignavibacteriales bacterium]|nr:insulinase family protein [Ignavibacteriales bacterium]
MRRILITIVVLLTVNGALAFPHANAVVPGDSAQRLQMLPKGVSVYQLNNGMKVLLIENPALPMVGANVVVKVGSAYETFSTSGMSHMLEHLLFNGTTSRMQKKLYDDVDRIGGYNNATTAEFYTNYMMVTPAENIKKGMELQADMLFNSTLPTDKFEKEKGIVLEEISKSLADPQEQLERNTLSILYRGHALSLPTLGTYSTIQSLSRDDVNSFYKNNYVPNNMILSVIGNFRTSAMLSLVQEIYGKARPGRVERQEDLEWATGFQIPSLTGSPNSETYHRFYEGEDVVLQALYQLPPSKPSEYYQLLSFVIEKNKDALQSSVKAEFGKNVKSVKLSTRVSHLGSLFEAAIILKPGTNLDAVVSSLSVKLAGLNFALAPDVVKSEVTKARTEFARNIEKPHMFGIYNADGIAKSGIESVLGSYTGDGLIKAAGELATLKLGFHPMVLIQAPSAKKDTAKARAAGLTRRFRDDASGKNLIVAQNEASKLLAVHYLVKHKSASEAKFGNEASKILHECLDQRLKSDANRKASSQFGFTFTVNDNPFIPMDDIYLHPDFGYVRVEGLADDIPGAIRYLNGQLKDFVPTEDEFKKAIEKYKGIEAMLMGGNKPQKLFDETYKPVVYAPEPVPQPRPVLTYDGLAAFAREYFKPSNMIISVVSPAAPESIDSLFNQFGFSPTKEEPPVFTPTFVSHDQPVKIEKAGNGERSYVFWGAINKIDPADAPFLQALSLVLSDNIVFDIREKQGMAYGMSAGVEIIQDKALFFVSQGTRPQNVDKLVPQYPKFFQMSVLDSLTEDQVEKSINMYLGRMMFRRLSSINQAFYLGTSVYFHNDETYDQRFLEQLKNAKLADVKNVARKYMRVTSPLLVIVR